MEIPNQKNLSLGDDPWAHGDPDVRRMRWIKQQSPEIEEVLAEILKNALTEWTLRHPGQPPLSSNFNPCRAGDLDGVRA
jgi:hypothetical protein